MAEMKEFEVYGYTPNAVIARFSEHHYPGVLIQGDALRIFLDEVEELLNEAAVGDMDIARAMQVKLVGLLTDHENILVKNDCERPYMNSVQH